MWFDPPETFHRKRDEKRMQQIAADSDAEETGKIHKWLDLAARFLSTDDQKDAKPGGKKSAAAESEVA